MSPSTFEISKNSFYGCPMFRLQVLGELCHSLHCITSANHDHITEYYITLHSTIVSCSYLFGLLLPLGLVFMGSVQFGFLTEIIMTETLTGSEKFKPFYNRTGPSITGYEWLHGGYNQSELVITEPCKTYIHH